MAMDDRSPSQHAAISETRGPALVPQGYREQVPRIPGPGSMQAPAAKPDGTFNNAREVLDWLGVQNRPPDSKRYDCYVGAPPAIPVLSSPPPGQSSPPQHRVAYADIMGKGHDVRSTALSRGGSSERHDDAHGPEVASVNAVRIIGPPHPQWRNTGVPSVAADANAKLPQAFGGPGHPEESLTTAKDPGGFLDAFPWVQQIFAEPDAVGQGQSPRGRSPRVAAPTSLRPGVIVQPVPGTPSTIIYSPDYDRRSLSFTSEQTDGGACQTSALCFVTLGLVFMPICLFVVSYYFTPQMSVQLPSPDASTSSATASISTTAAPLSTSPNQETTVITSTVDPWTNVPDFCLDKHAPITDADNLMVTAYNPVRMNAVHKIFCLYNNSRFRRTGLFDFVPENLPLNYCNYVVYWSVSVVNASVSSRLELFDTSYGLWRLKETLNNHLLAQQVGVLMALGGYQNDSPHFSRLGRDPPAMARFVASVIQTISAHQLDGVTIHWVVPHMACRTASDALTMLNLVDRLREAYWLNGWVGSNTTSTKLVTAIFPADLHVANQLVDLLADKLDFVFFETHLFQPTTVRIGCRDIATEVFRFFSSLYSFSGHEEKLCSGISLTPWAAIESHGTLDLALNASVFTALPGTAAVFEVCRAQELCLDTNEQNCDFIKIPISSVSSTDATTVTASGTVATATTITASGITATGTSVTASGTTATGSTLTASATIVTNTAVVSNMTTSVTSRPPIPRTFEPIRYMFHTNQTLFRVLAHGASPLAANTRTFCVLLYDLDMDNYNAVCPGAGIDRIALQHFHNTVHLPSTDVLRTLMPPC